MQRRSIRACDQLKNFKPKIAVFENRIAEYREVFEKRKYKRSLFAGQKTIIDQKKIALFLADIKHVVIFIDKGHRNKIQDMDTYSLGKERVIFPFF